MPFKSARQRRYMFAVVPDAAKKWAHGRKTRPSDWRKRKPSRTYVSAVVAAGYKDTQRRDGEGKWTDGGINAPSLPSLPDSREGLMEFLQDMWPDTMLNLSVKEMSGDESSQVATQLGRLQNQYPSVEFSAFKVSRNSRDMRGGKYRPGGYLEINIADADARIERSASENWLVPSSDGGIGYIIRHEHGHAAHETIGANNPEFLQAVSEAVAKVAGDRFRILPSRTEPWPETWVGSSDYDFKQWIRGQLSDYAATKPYEMIAEAWSEYTDKGGKPRPLAQAIGEVMEEFLAR